MSPLASASGVLRRMGRAFSAPTDIANLVWFRMAFGFILFADVLRFFFKGWIHQDYLAPSFHFKYFGFSWVQPWPGWGLYLHFGVLGLAALGVALGLCYRAAAVVFFLGFTYVFLLDQTTYLNHHYFVCLLSFLLIFLPAHRALSLDAWRRPSLQTDTAPYWTLWLPRMQLSIVYFMAGVAKLNGDWLAGEPMRAWLLNRMDYPVLGPYFDEPWVPYFFSYGGLFFDLLVAPMLWWRRTRWLAFALAALFNLTNSWLFNIGIFPWLTLGTTVLLFQTGLPRPFPSRWRSLAPSSRPAPSPARRRLVGWLVAAYLAFQLLVPLRHWLYPGDVAWTEEGHRFSWRMMLRSKTGDLTLKIHDPATTLSWEVFPQAYLTDRQYAKTRTRPDMILQLCHHVAADLAARGTPGVEVRALARVSLNGRPAAPLVDPEVDLAAEPRSLRPASWIMHLPAGVGSAP